MGIAQEKIWLILSWKIQPLSAESKQFSGDEDGKHLEEAAEGAEDEMMGTAVAGNL